MLNDPKKFSIIIPTRNRPAFLRRTLSFLAIQGYKGKVYIADASDDTGKSADAVLCNLLPPFEWSRIWHRERRGVWLETAEACDLAGSEYVAWLHDDDFLFLDVAAKCVAALEADRGAVTAQGREIFITTRRGADNRILFNAMPSPRYAVTGANSVVRVDQNARNYCHLFFAVARRATFAGACHIVGKYCRKGVFDQYAMSAILAACGRSILLDDLMMVRHRHGGNHSAIMPALVANGNFSEVVEEYRQALDQCLGPRSLNPFHALFLDAAIVNLVRRSFIGTKPDEIDAKLAESSALNTSCRAWYQCADVRASIEGHPETAG